jgi:predicted TIM-barrel fold metal-dependent hydrolase
MSIYDEPKIDCHNHVFDPERFPYGVDTIYAPIGAELGTPAQIVQVFDAYGVRHALMVGPNSGYNLDNRCLLDTLAQSAGRFKGIAVVRNDATRDEVWGSDWPVLRSPERIDYGRLLKIVEALPPDAADRRKLLWDTPRRLFGFGA